MREVDVVGVRAGLKWRPLVVTLDSMGGHTPIAEVEEVRSELERRFTAAR